MEKSLWEKIEMKKLMQKLINIFCRIHKISTKNKIKLLLLCWNIMKCYCYKHSCKTQSHYLSTNLHSSVQMFVKICNYTFITFKESLDDFLFTFIEKWFRKETNIFLICFSPSQISFKFYIINCYFYLWFVSRISGCCFLEFDAIL